MTHDIFQTRPFPPSSRRPVGIPLQGQAIISSRRAFLSRSLFSKFSFHSPPLPKAQKVSLDNRPTSDTSPSASCTLPVGRSSAKCLHPLTSSCRLRLSLSTLPHCPTALIKRLGRLSGSPGGWVIVVCKMGRLCVSPKVKILSSWRSGRTVSGLSLARYRYPPGCAQL